MSTLEVACGRCEKRFRVRAEFAGKSSRCPGCSAPLVIAGTRPAEVPKPRRDEPDERPRPRRPRDEDDTPGPSGNWKPVYTALGREQGAVLFGLVTFVSSFVVWGLGSAMTG